MPLKLVPPRKANPNWQIRGSYLHVKRLYRSAGSPEKRIAEQALRKLKRDIESGAFSEDAGLTFAAAAMSYLRAGGEKRFIGPLNEYFQLTPLDKIDQAAIDLAAEILHPGDPAEMAPTRNRQVYTPVSAILKHAGREKALKRPKGARGKLRLHWLQPDDAFKLLAAAEALEARFGALCTFLVYTGCRLSEALRLTWKDTDLPAAFAYVRDTKNGDPRPVFLPPVVVAALANLGGDDGRCQRSGGNPDRPKAIRNTQNKRQKQGELPSGAQDRQPEGEFAAGVGAVAAINQKEVGGPVFRYTKGRWLYRLLAKAEQASGVTIPDGIAFHIFRHTYGAWMRRHGGLDTSGLVKTGAWKSPDAARVYEHVEFSEEAAKAALLPTRKVK